MKKSSSEKCILFIVIALTATPKLSEAKEYKLRDIVKEFVAYSPAIRSARSELSSSHYGVRKATSRFFPNISANGNVTEYRSPSLGAFPGQPLTGKTYQGTIDLVQPLLVGGANWNGLEVAKLNRALKEQQYLSTKQDAIFGILSSALQLASLRDQKSILEESQRYQERFYKLTQGKAARGAAKSFEVSQARADYLSYGPRIESINSQISNLEEKIKTDLGLTEEQSIQLRMPEPGMFQKYEISQLLDQARENRPDYKQSELAVEVNRTQKWLSLADEMPSLNIIGQVGYKSPTQEDWSKETTKFHSIGLSLKIPLFSGLSSMHKYREGEENIRVSEERLALARNRLKEEVQTSYDTLNLAKRIYDNGGEWAKEARKALNGSIDSYRIGVVTSTQVIQVQRGWEAAELSLVNSRQGYHTALLALRRALGVDLEKIYGEGEL